MLMSYFSPRENKQTLLTGGSQGAGWVVGGWGEVGGLGGGGGHV